MDTLFAPILAYAKQKGFRSERVQKAYDLAKQFHDGQTRKSGEPYITHVLAVAQYLTTYDADEDSLIAGLLHDVVEDTHCTIEDIRNHFGEETTVLIDGLTKFSKKDFLNTSNLDRKIESLRKWFAVMQKDVRVAVIKLFDRLHNMETLGHHGNPEKELGIAKETLDVHVKIAAKLGLFKVKADLERHSLRYIDPEAAQRVEYVAQTQALSAAEIIPEFKKLLTTSQERPSIILDIQHSPLSPMKIYQRELHTKNFEKQNIPLSLSVLTNNSEDCYTALYLIHSTFPVEPSYFQDYINTPKLNGYRGLHTTVVTPGGRRITFKIRSKEMEEYFHRGITLYCFSSHGHGTWLPSWIQNLQYVTNERKTDSHEFWEQLQHDILEESILVHTEGEESLLLPAHSTLLDAAFSFYGNRALFIEYARVNGTTTPLYQHLKHQDVVHYQFSTESQVNYTWMEYVDTAMALNFIRTALQESSASNKVHIGSHILKRALLAEGRGFVEELDKHTLAKLLSTYSVSSLDQLYVGIAEGAVSAYDIIQKFFVHHKKSPGLYSTQLSIILPDATKEAEVFSLLSTSATHLKNYHYAFSHNTHKIRAKLYLKDRAQERSLKSFLKKNTGALDIRFHRPLHTALYLSLLFTALGFWGIQPVLVSYMYSYTLITPQELIFMRIWIPTLLLLIWLLIRLIFFQKNTLIPLFNRYILLGTITLLGSIIARYYALTITPPTFNAVIYRNYVFVVLLSAIPIFTLWKRKKYFLQFLILFFLANTLLLALTPEWPLWGKILSITASLFFAIHSINNSKFAQKYTVKARHDQYITVMHLYCAIIFSLFFPVSLATEWQLFSLHPLLFSFFILAIFIPYIVTYYLSLKYERFAHITMITSSFIWVVSLCAEIFILHHTVPLIAILTGLLFVLATYTLLELQKSVSRREPETLYFS